MPSATTSSASAIDVQVNQSLAHSIMAIRKINRSEIQMIQHEYTMKRQKIALRHALGCDEGII
jgi:hypothetical protein